MDRRPRTPSEFEEKIVQVNRVSKKTKGGNQIGFAVLVVVGDKKGRVGVALGKAPDVLSSIKKGVRKAKKLFITVPIRNETIPFRIEIKFGAARVLLKPAPKGSGIIAGGAVRDVLEVAGIKNVVGKILGSNNQGNNAYATIEALKRLQLLCQIKGIETK
jgi:small subunit ribosomal protein S5